MAADKLTVRGLGNLDGEYEFDLLDLIVVGAPGCFTVAEYRRIKRYAGIRRGEIADAIENDDAEFEVVLAAIILARHGKNADEGRLEQKDALAWEFASREAEEAEQDPPAEPAETPETEPQSRSGGESSKLRSVSSENGLSLTGTPV